MQFVYFKLGLSHITDIGAYDHILFIIALCAIYRLEEWRKILILVTAFTLGHSITLALAALKIITPDANWIEFLIPLTILATSIYNVINKNNKNININYIFALFFGLIHGMGFSNFFRSLMGENEDVIAPLFAFNIGIEAGQLMIVAVILLFSSYIVLNKLNIKQREWTLFISGATAGIAITLLIETGKKLFYE